MSRVKPTSEAFGVEKRGSVVVIRLRASAYELARDLQAKESFHAAIASVDLDQAAKVLLLHVPPTGLDPETYAEFLRQGLDASVADLDARSSRLDVQFSREENALAQFVQVVHQLKKVTIICLRGRMAAPFVGASLACDFRLASEGTGFALNDMLLGVPPGGAIGYFLPRYVGFGKATELLLREEPVPASEALVLGLISAVFTEAAFEEQCLAWAERITRFPLSAVVGMKSLLRAYPEAELSQYLQTENKTMRQAMLAHWEELHPRDPSAG